MYCSHLPGRLEAGSWLGSVSAAAEKWSGEACLFQVFMYVLCKGRPKFFQNTQRKLLDLP